MKTAKLLDVVRWKVVCAYDGSTFAGWQSQPKGPPPAPALPAVQDVIEERLTTILKTPIRIIGSGRTDSGVHARAQVFHFDAAWRHGTLRFMAALRATLPLTIQIISIKKVSKKFHARYSPTGKRYIYNIYLGDASPFVRPYAWEVFDPLDINTMKEAAAILVGRNDFRAFSTAEKTVEENTVRLLTRLEVKKRGRSITIIAEGEGFLYKMARSLVGSLVAVGEGKLTPKQIKEILDSKKRVNAVQTAPAHGLFLDKVFYPKELS
jgi:tRNA pseudouridine38-40 synthase